MEEAGAEEVEVVGAMFPGPDGEPPPAVVAAAAALRSNQAAAFTLSIPLLLLSSGDPADAQRHTQTQAEDDDDGGEQQRQQREVMIELYCALPATYPAQAPQLAVREATGTGTGASVQAGPRPCLARAAADELQLALARHVEAHCPLGEQGRLFEAIRWLQENAAASFAWTPSAAVTAQDGEGGGGGGGEERHWLWSHHIYGKKKRRIMPEWASELRLRGACLAGKPGLIVIEGDSQRVREFVRRVRSMPWQRLVIKLEETLSDDHGHDGGDAPQRFPAFKEVTFDGLKEILERLGLEQRLGEVLGMKHVQEE